MIVVIDDREGDAHLAYKACMRSDSAKEWGETSITVSYSKCGESEAVFGVEQWAGLAVHLFIDAEKFRTETGLPIRK